MIFSKKAGTLPINQPFSPIESGAGLLFRDDKFAVQGAEVESYCQRINFVDLLRMVGIQEKSRHRLRDQSDFFVHS